MTTTKQTLHDEHAEFVPYLDLIRKAADGVGEFPPGAMRAMLDEIHEFLSHKLIPHAVAEGRVLYPVVRQVSGTPEVTVRMNRCHVELGRFADEVARLRGSLGTSPRQEQELRRVLYEEWGVVRSRTRPRAAPRPRPEAGPRLSLACARAFPRPVPCSDTGRAEDPA